jgi:hypothetical protein
MTRVGVIGECSAVQAGSLCLRPQDGHSKDACRCWGRVQRKAARLAEQSLAIDHGMATAMTRVGVLGVGSVYTWGGFYSPNIDTLNCVRKAQGCHRFNLCTCPFSKLTDSVSKLSAVTMYV